MVQWLAWSPHREKVWGSNHHKQSYFFLSQRQEAQHNTEELSVTKGLHGGKNSKIINVINCLYYYWDIHKVEFQYWMLMFQILSSSFNL